MSITTPKILKFGDSSKTQKQKHLENETLFFLQIKKISHYTGYYIDKNVLAEITFKSFLM